MLHFGACYCDAAEASESRNILKSSEAACLVEPPEPINKLPLKLLSTSRYIVRICGFAEHPTTLLYRSWSSDPFPYCGSPEYPRGTCAQAAFFKTLALVQSLTYTLVFELHDNSTPGNYLLKPTGELLCMTQSTRSWLSQGAIEISSKRYKGGPLLVRTSSWKHLK